jgi:hypothetical protein
MDSYKIVFSDVSDFGVIGENDMVKDLEEKVNTHINQGWSCIGGIVLCHHNSLTTRIYQTMIKNPV